LRRECLLLRPKSAAEYYTVVAIAPIDSIIFVLLQTTGARRIEAGAQALRFNQFPFLG
jgi:hypothetical protein